jgi:hypothetical protein
MKKTVRILSMILSAGMLFSIAGCGKKEESSERTTKTKEAAVTTEDTSDTSSEESTEPSETTPDPTDLNNNGASDYEEDADNDGLSDGQARDLGLDPRNPDTDYDGLEDALEVSTGNDPLTGSELFRLTKEISGENVTAGLDMNVDKEALTSITLDLYKEDALINSTIPGYIGSPITASASGRIGLCQITFDISEDVLMVTVDGEDGDLSDMNGIYYRDYGDDETEDEDVVFDGDETEEADEYFDDEDLEDPWEDETE